VNDCYLRKEVEPFLTQRQVLLATLTSIRGFIHHVDCTGPDGPQNRLRQPNSLLP
jgi:hypothetical protein